MNQLISELRNGIPEFIPGTEEGQLLVNVRPSTSVMLRAARELERLASVLNNQNNTLNSLTREIQQNNEEITKLKEQLCALQSTQKNMESLQPGEPTATQETTV